MIVGLGNPGKEYRHTPHNVGFEVADRLAERLGAKFRNSLRFRAATAAATHAGEALVLVKPRTYMNNSGVAVAAVLRYRKATSADIIAVVDDADLPMGRLRVKARGGSGGHRGLESLIQHVKSDGFTRVRIGVGRDTGGRGLIGHVLSPFSKADRREMDAVLERAVAAVLCIVECGVAAAMNGFNGLPDGPN